MNPPDKDEEDAKIIIDMVHGDAEKWREVRDYIQHICTNCKKKRSDYKLFGVD